MVIKMQKLEFSKLYDLDYNLRSLFAMRQYWKENSCFKMVNPRKTSCLLWLCGCAAKYCFYNNELYAPRGSVVYIPEGAIYETMFLDCDKRMPSTILVEFGMYLPNGEHICTAEAPCVIKQDNSVVVDELFNEAADAYSIAVTATSKIKSIIYSLLSTLSYSERQESIYSRGFNTIAKGIDFLESDFKSETSIKSIAELCHVSESTFRRLFKEYTGKSPLEYRIERRISYAKKLLKTGSMSIIEVALETGFDDPAYFCRVFKKHTGVTAGEYLRSL